MPKKETAQKLIVVESTGTIGELGGISGPVTSPCYVPIETINLLLNHHRKVYEVNPENYSEKVALSLKNLRRENFAKKSTTPVKANLAPNIHTEAVVRNSNSINSKDFSTDTMVTPKVVKAKTAKTEKTEVVAAPATEAPKSDFVKND